MSWPFDEFIPPPEFDTAEFGLLLDELHAFHGALAAALPNRDDTISLRETLAKLRSRLETKHTDIESAPYGQLDDLPCHGLGQLPAWHVTHETSTTLHATFAFSRWHIGGGGAAHGGMVTTILDDMMGSLASKRGRSPARTAYLNTSFKALTPVETPLDATVAITSSGGRKLFAHAEIRHGRRICAEADALFIVVDGVEQCPTPDISVKTPTGVAANGLGSVDGHARPAFPDHAPSMARSCPSQ